jgi:3-hydroxybutyryl-CoA dehydrogenase
MEIKKVGVLGCGLMGAGIAQTAASAGFETTVREISEELLQKGFVAIEKSLERFAQKGTITAEQQKQTRDRLFGTTSFDDLTDCDIIVEAIIENLEEKHKTYRQLDAICKPETIFASNTSSLSITEMMAVTSPERQERFIGMHFFNPVPIMKLVEVVRTILTGSDVYEEALAFATRLGKVPVRASDKTGFIVNRLLVPYMLDSIRALEEGVGSIVDIDNAMKLGCGYPMGPLTLGDFVGLDTTYYIAEIMFNEFREKRFAPPPLLKRMVMAGLYGRKSGRGFYDYTKDPKNPTPMNLVFGPSSAKSFALSRSGGQGCPRSISLCLMKEIFGSWILRRV